MPDIDWKAVRSAVKARKIDEAIDVLSGLSDPAKAWFLVQLAPSAGVALSLVDCLLDQGAAIEYGARGAGSPLFHAVSQPRVVKRLLEAGADPNARNKRGHTPLMAAADRGQPQSIKALIAAGAEVNAQSKADKTALLFACDQGHGKCAAALLEAGADPATFSAALKSARSHPALRKDKILLARLSRSSGGRTKKASAKKERR